MHRIKNKDTVKMLEDVLNYSDEEIKIIKENFAPLLQYSSKEYIERQITELIKEGKTSGMVFYAKVFSSTQVAVERIDVEFEEELVEE